MASVFDNGELSGVKPCRGAGVSFFDLYRRLLELNLPHDIWSDIGVGPATDQFVALDGTELTGAYVNSRDTARNL